MDFEDLKNKRIILFCGNLSTVGGAERVMLEEAKYLEKNGAEVYILALKFDREVLFDETYKPDVQVIAEKSSRKTVPIRFIASIVDLRKKIKEINPHIIISEYADCCIYLYFATLFIPYLYVTHIPGTIFWLLSDRVYAFIHRKVFNEIRESVIGQKQFVPLKRPNMSLAKRIKVELNAILLYIGVRKAKKIFVHSKQMKWEVSKLYGKEAIALKGAFHPNVLNYKPKLNIKQKLGLEDKRVILNVNRLDPRKRVDLLIKAFKPVCEKFGDVALVIGGIGPDEGRLKTLVRELAIQDRVKFAGYINEEELWDYYAGCDVFVHPNWADYAIAPFEALALQKKVVWSTEMEIDEALEGNRHIFAANPTVDDFVKAMEKALTTEVTEENDMSDYTWDMYFEKITGELLSVMREMGSGLSGYLNAEERGKLCLESTIQRESKRTPSYVSHGCDTILRRLSTFKSLRGDERVLDLGCGTCQWTIYLTGRGFEAHGIDIWSDYIQLGKNEAKRREIHPPLVMGRTEQLPYRNDVFDIVLACSVLEHVSDWKKTIAEVARVLKPGGVAYFVTTNRLYPTQGEVNGFPFYSYLPQKIKDWITHRIMEKNPARLDFTPYPARHWFTYYGLQKGLVRVGFTRFYDRFNLIKKDELPKRYRWIKPFLPLLRRLPPSLRNIPISATLIYAIKG